MSIQTFELSSTGPTLAYDAVAPCNPNYFSNAINPVNLTDCYLFTNNAQLDFSYLAATQSIAFGFQTSLNCPDPFFCASGNAVYTAAQNGFTGLFSNYTFTLYFTSRILTPNGNFQD
jgi:hypothetical protein